MHAEDLIDLVDELDAVETDMFDDTPEQKVQKRI
jgi:hypothetical protein